jgi:hypothetical protein
VRFSLNKNRLITTTLKFSMQQPSLWLFAAVTRRLGRRRGKRREETRQAKSDASWEGEREEMEDTMSKLEARKCAIL